jgi:pyruvate,water dikinase
MGGESSCAMTDLDHDDRGLFKALQERAKELACLYAIEEILRDPEQPLGEAARAIVAAIPRGWQHPELCRVRIHIGDERWESPDFADNPWGQCAEIRVQGRHVGEICVHYRHEVAGEEQGLFLPEERKLIETISERLGHFLLHQQLRLTFEQSAKRAEDSDHRDWRVALELLQTTDAKLYDRVARRMLNHLCWQGIGAASDLLERYGADPRPGRETGEVNLPGRRSSSDERVRLREEIFGLAAEQMPAQEIEHRIHTWVREDKAAHLVRPFSDVNLTLERLGEAVRRYQRERDLDLSDAAAASLRVALIRRLITDRLDFITVAKRHIDIDDFMALAERIIGPLQSTGKLGGKSAGLFLAEQILANAEEPDPDLPRLRTPRTWYLASDGLLAFVRHNNLDEVWEQKYRPIESVRQDYPHIVQLFKSSHFPREVSRALAQALDELGDVPLVVRSSSLLEDQLGAAFSGKYKSLFLANQGSRQERLEALEDAIAEIYASVFGPDPIEYRAERGLLDFHEEMGILIQEVVGQRAGRFFLPSFAGVAFSRNEFRWSPRIRREDGLVRLVPGLGTRAVDRLTDDYPVLVAPGQPELRVNASVEEVMRYSPKQVDVIDLERNRFTTVRFHELVKELGEGWPLLGRMVSVYRDGHLQRPMPYTTDYRSAPVICTFEALLATSPLVRQLADIMARLEEALGAPVDIEFAHDGEDLYLLQCRPQSHRPDDHAAEIPRNPPKEDVVFTANRFVSNGHVPDLRYLVWVDGEAYAALSDEAAMLAVGRAVGKLNRLLPRRRFALMGPGRWGSRGDIRLGVRVTYSDISNTALLVEVARRKGSYVPDLSFGTHFFQDLVEASIRYLPLYPDEQRVVFDEDFLRGAPNALATLLPEEAALGGVLRVIDVGAARDGRVLRVLMNAREDEAMALLVDPGSSVGFIDRAPEHPPTSRGSGEECWRWRVRMAHLIANCLDTKRFDVRAAYLIGSSKNATAGPASDIDLVFHVGEDRRRHQDLLLWLEGWSRSLAEENHRTSGHRSEGLLDVHLVNDEEVHRREGFAAHIGATTNAARPLELGPKGRRATP